MTMIIDHLHNAKNYTLGSAGEKAFEFLTSLDADAAVGEYELDGRDVYASVMHYATKPHANAVLESHCRYVDIQMALSGAETIEWYRREPLAVKEVYDVERDVEFYHRPGGVSPGRVTLSTGIFAILLPRDAHMPSLHAEGHEEIKKVVVKIRRDLIFC